MARTYATIDTEAFQNAVASEELDIELLFSIISETSMDTLRYSLDGSLFVIKTSSTEGATYLRTRAAELDIPYVEYNYEDILVIMNSEAWSDPNI